jgi:hypothetical protein
VVFIGLGILGIATGESVVGLALILLNNILLSTTSAVNALNNKNVLFYRFKKFTKKININVK